MPYARGAGGTNGTKASNTDLDIVGVDCRYGRSAEARRTRRASVVFADMALFELQFPIKDVTRHASRYSYEDDDEQRAMGRAAGERGWYLRKEFVEICRWKTTRSAPLVARNGAGEVKAATRTALAGRTDERECMRALRGLSGVNWATASVLLHLAYPEYYPIWDVRALQALGVEGRFTASYRRWAAYVAIDRDVIERAGVGGRTLDNGMWQWSVDHDGPLRS